MTQSPTFGAVLGTGASGSQVRQDVNLSNQALASDALAPVCLQYFGEGVIFTRNGGYHRPTIVFAHSAEHILSSSMIRWLELPA